MAAKPGVVGESGRPGHRDGGAVARVPFDELLGLCALNGAYAPVIPATKGVTG